MDGLHFACVKGCTNCCRQHGFVYLSPADLLRAASFLRLTPEQFESRYVYRTRHRLRLRKPRRSQCPFLEHGGCAIHPAKPTQCRVFPFWPELTSDQAAWAETARYCPGIGSGPLVSIQTLSDYQADMRQGYPYMYSAAG